MSAMSKTGQRFGIRYIIDIVTGADTKRIHELRHDRIKTYGAGKHKDKNHWRFLIDELLAQDVIYQDGDRYPILKLTEKGNNVLYGTEKITALKREDAKERRRAVSGRKFEPYDNVLFEKLRILRKKLADEQQVPPFIIFSDRSLHEMCRYYPAILPDMKKISGVGDAKLKRYGNDFMWEIKAYLNENPRIPVPDRESFASPATMTQKKSKGETFEKTYELIKKGLSIEETAKTRNLSISTITAHLERLIRNSRDIEIDRVVDPVKRAEIENLFLTLQTWSLGTVVEHFNGTVNYDEAKLVRAYLQRKTSEN